MTLHGGNVAVYLLHRIITNRIIIILIINLIIITRTIICSRAMCTIITNATIIIFMFADVSSLLSFINYLPYR